MNIGDLIIELLKSVSAKENLSTIMAATALIGIVLKWRKSATDQDTHLLWLRKQNEALTQEVKDTRGDAFNHLMEMARSTADERARDREILSQTGVRLEEIETVLRTQETTIQAGFTEAYKRQTVIVDRIIDRVDDLERSITGGIGSIRYIPRRPHAPPSEGDPQNLSDLSNPEQESSRDG